MTDLLRCNVCFRQPGRETSRFAITNCGHVACELCLQKGKKDECGVCRSHCRTIFLSNETHADIKMLFMDINVLCTKFSKEFTNIAKLEETIKELTQQLENYSFRASQSYNRLPASGEFRTLGPTYSEKQTGVSPYSVPISRVPSAKTLEPMDFAPSAPKKKNFTIAGPTRLSLISPPQDGRMGHVPFRSNTAGSLRSAMGHSQPNVFHQLSQSISQTDRTSVLGSSSQRSTQIFPQTPLFTPSSGARQPITLANILQRRH
ncbi:putative E3 SUMO-protein ligase RNF212 isoform X3 [Mixophyes fleayi]|uniref:putative E3 SUMO-protein ligase RNF212 isoform X3 n=1 Tax=Mixophyes fleayi TaxID=3061075 RepID=UPI003F4DE31A